MPGFSIKCPAALDPDQSAQLLSYQFNEALGQPWRLQTRFLHSGPQPQWAPDLEISVQSPPLLWRGFVTAIHWAPYERSRGFLTIDAFALPLSCTVDPHYRAIPSAQGLAGLLEQVFGDSVRWEWIEPEISALPSHQWLQMGETDWAFLRRICSQLALHAGWFPDSSTRWGTLYSSLPNFGAISQLPLAAQQSATFSQQYLGSRCAHLTTSQEGLFAGKRIQGNETWVIQRATHSLNQEGSVLGTGPIHPAQSELLLQKEESFADIVDPPAHQSSTWIGSISEEKSSAPPIQANGHYPVCIQIPNHEPLACASVRAAQIFSAPQGGIHWPLQPGTPVLLGLEPNNPDEPLILSTLPNPENPCPANDEHPNWMLMRSNAGAEWRIEDRDPGTAMIFLSAHGIEIRLDDQSQELRLHNGACTVTLDQAKQQIRLATASGILLQLDHKAQRVRLEMPGGARVECEASQAIRTQLDEHTILELTPGNIRLQAQDEITLSADHVRIEGQRTVQLHGTQDIILQASQIHLN